MYQMEDLLSHFNPQVYQNDNIYDVVYEKDGYKGNVIYEKKIREKSGGILEGRPISELI